jgi:5'(3')-deoxyribonucleotidase
MIIGIDVDEVCLDLASSWLSLYNLEFDDNVTVDKWVDWDVSKFVKPEAVARMMEYVEYPDVFYGSKPIDGALESVKILKNHGFRIVYITANNPENCKLEWLKSHGFLENNKDFVQAYDKSLILTSVLFDDRYENCRDFKGMGILFNKPWNQKYEYWNRVNNWEEFLRKII